MMHPLRTAESDLAIREDEENVPRQELVDAQAHQPNALDNSVDDAMITELAPAFRESAPVRLLYLQTVIGSTFSSRTVSESNQQLLDGLDIIAMCNSLPDASFPKPATTLVTAKRRLGLDVDADIVTVPICTREKRMSRFVEGEPDAAVMKHIPAKIHAYVPIEKTVARFLLRADFVRNLRDSSKDAERPEPTEFSVMQDIHDAAGWTQLEVGLKRVINADESVRDVEVFPGSRKKLVLCEIGLNITLNMDWFGITDNRPHSCGAIYAVFNDIYRAVRYTSDNAPILTTIPGPFEPSLEQLNHIVMPIKDGLMKLYGGEFQAVGIHLHENAGLGPSLTGADFKLRDDWEQLAHAFRSYRAKSETARTKILDETGSRHSEMNWIPGWGPIKCAPLDFMHNFYGIVKDFWMSVIVDGYLFDADRWRQFESTINESIWPSGIGRLPDNLSTNHSQQKADQWRRLCRVQPVLLFLAWRESHTDNISSTAPKIPPQSTSRPKFRRNTSEIYKLGLYLSVVESILAAKSITIYDAERAQRYLQMFCQGCLRLGIPLKPNHHLAMHYLPIFIRFGPAYAWWLFAFERFNGILEKVNLNGHAGGEMELTLLRDWILKQRVHELVASLPPDASPQEKKLIARLSTEHGSNRGTLRTSIAGFGAGTTILTPKSVRAPTNLRRLPHTNLYALLLAYALTVWTDISIVDDFSTEDGAVPFSGATSATSYPFLVKDGVRYGCLTATRTDADHLALVNIDASRTPCQLLYHFGLTVGERPSVLCSVVRRLETDADIPQFPWDLYATDLTTYAVYADSFGPLEVVPASALVPVCGVVSLPMTSNTLRDDRPLSIMTSMDHSGIPADDAWLDDLVQDLN
ncbi:hypothetical protein C8R43DRAFT_1136739 [Mycena crocata]|nr:hypothetical protein C8R43DRAFT_1136739 [Mycena crocata]